MSNLDDLHDDLHDDLDDLDDLFGDALVPCGPLPLAPAQTAALARAVTAGLRDHGCDNTLRAAQAWARRAEVGWSRLRDALEERGGYCDCEVLLNVLESPD